MCWGQSKLVAAWNMAKVMNTICQESMNVRNSLAVAAFMQSYAKLTVLRFLSFFPKRGWCWPADAAGRCSPTWVCFSLISRGSSPCLAKSHFKVKAWFAARKEAFNTDSGLRRITALGGHLIPVHPPPLPHTGDFSGEVEKPHFPADRPRCWPGSQRSLHHRHGDRRRVS